MRRFNLYLPVELFERIKLLSKFYNISITKLMVELLNIFIEELPTIQKNRLKKYYIEHKTYEKIAIEEGCTKRAVKFSIDIAIQKLSKKFKN